MTETTDIQKPASEAVDPASAGSDVWEYSEYRATLRLNGNFFALITPDGRNAISKEAASKLIAALNRPNDKSDSR